MNNFYYLFCDILYYFMYFIQYNLSSASSLPCNIFKSHIFFILFLQIQRFSVKIILVAC